MKKALIILSGAVAAILAGAIGFLAYMGWFGPMPVAERAMGPYTLVYESFTGPYQETGPVFDRIYKQMQQEGIPATQGLGIYYDDPRRVPKDKLRSDCGVVLPADSLARTEELEAKYTVKALEKKPSLVTEFPVRNSMSYLFGPMKAYPALMRYAARTGKKITMTYELYDESAKRIHFVAVLGE